MGCIGWLYLRVEQIEWTKKKIFFILTDLLIVGLTFVINNINIKNTFFLFKDHMKFHLKKEPPASEILDVPNVETVVSVSDVQNQLTLIRWVF